LVEARIPTRNRTVLTHKNESRRLRISIERYFEERRGIEDNAGLAFYLAGKIPESLTHFRRAVSVLPETTIWGRTANWHLGDALRNSGNDEEALASYLKAYDLESPDQIKRAVIQTLYKRVNGSLDGLDQKIGPAVSYASGAVPKTGQAAPATDNSPLPPASLVPAKPDAKPVTKETGDIGLPSESRPAAADTLPAAAAPNSTTADQPRPQASPNSEVPATDNVKPSPGDNPATDTSKDAPKSNPDETKPVTPDQPKSDAGEVKPAEKDQKKADPAETNPTTPDSPKMRDTNPTVVLIPGIGMFSFGKNKTEARITGEFYTNAIHVMEGATALGSGKTPEKLPQAASAAKAEAFAVHANYVALPPSEAFRIEYWQLEEAKIRRQPPEKELSRRVVMVVGGGNGVGQATAWQAAQRGAHVVIADRDTDAAKNTAAEAQKIAGKEGAAVVSIDIRDREAIRKALREVIATYGGIDILINTAAIFPSSSDGVIHDAQWATTLDVNVTANHRLADELGQILREQNLEGSIVLTSSANAVVPKRGSEAYDVSKAALSHLVRELAISLAPRVRVNGISPATVVKGSTMFPRDRVIASLTKYEIKFDPQATDEQLRGLLAEFYAKRTLTHQPIEPEDCAAAILFLAGPDSRCTTGHLIPVDGGLTEAFLR